MTDTEVFLNIINKYKKMNVKFIEIYFSDRDPLGLLLEGAALGELCSMYDRNPYNEDDFEENINYSLDNGYIHTIYYPSKFEYTHPVLFIENAYELCNQIEDGVVNNRKIYDSIDVGINMNIENIVEIKAYITYSWVDNNGDYCSIEDEEYELYEDVIDYI